MNKVKVNARPKLTYVVTVSLSMGFFYGQVAYLIANGFDVDIISSYGPELDAIRKEGATCWPVSMMREIDIPKDIVSLERIWRYLRRTRPDIVVTGSPKAGLLGTVAARMAGVPIVVYTIHGLRMETASRWKQRLLWFTEWIACHAAHNVRCVSPSLRARVIDLGLIAPEHCEVVGAGTSNGVDIERWRCSTDSKARARLTRHRLGIPSSAPVIGFVGRFVRDKGIAELYEAFRRLRKLHPDLRLLLVGSFEVGDPVSTALRVQIEADAGVICAGVVKNVETYYWAMDVLALPTYREGLPAVPLEAQAASIPVVSTDATGAIDAIVDGVTGLCVPVGDVDELTAALHRLLADPVLRNRMGRAGRAWVEQNFRRESVWKNLLLNYRSILQPATNLQRGACK